MTRPNGRSPDKNTYLLRDDKPEQNSLGAMETKNNRLVIMSSVILHEPKLAQNNSFDAGKNRRSAQTCYLGLCKLNLTSIKRSFTWANNLMTPKDTRKQAPRSRLQPTAIYDGRNFDKLLPACKNRKNGTLFSKRKSYSIAEILILLITTLQFSISFSHCLASNDSRCKDGFYPTGNKLSGKLCEDINECESGMNPCDQHCYNTMGSFECLCYPGFRLLSDGISCISEDPVKILISSENKIYSVTLGGDDLSTELSEAEILFEAKSDIVSFSLSMATNEIYYVEISDGLWVYDILTGEKSRKTSAKNGDSQNTTIPSAKLVYNWGDSSLLMAVDLRILKFENKFLDSSFYISEVNQRISDFAIDPVNQWLFITELGAQPRLIIHNMDSKSKLHDLVTPLTNTYLQTELKISTNVYDSLIYFVTSTGSMESCELITPNLQWRSYSFQDVNKSFHCDSLLAEGNVSSQVASFGNMLYFLSQNDELVSCDRRNCTATMSKLYLDFKTKDIVMWTSHSQQQKKDIDCRNCDKKISQCEIYDDWFTKCKCKPGFTTSADGSCVDINECDEPSLNLCEDQCVNADGNFHCRCTDPNSILATDGFTCDITMQSCAEERCSHGCVDNSTRASENQIFAFGYSSETSSGIPVCTCPVGSYLKEDKHTCTGCRAGDNGGCSHICTETGISSFECACPSGYVMSKDLKTCYVEWDEMVLIAASNSEIRVFDLTSMEVIEESKIKGIKHMSFDQEHRLLYFISENPGRVGKLNLTDMTSETLFSAGWNKFTSIAIDWYYDTLYLTEETHGSIVKIKLKTSTTQQHVVAKDLKNPRELTIDSDTGLLYFVTDSETQENKNSLMQLKLSNNILLTLSSTMNDTKSLTIDYLQQMLYFSDVKSGKIQSVNIEQSALDSGDSLEVLTNNDVAFVDNLQIIQDTIYTLDVYRRWKIVTYSKLSGKKINNLSKNKRSRIGDLNKLIVVHWTRPINDRRPEYGPCSVNNGGCSHVCEDFLNRVVCSCYQNYTLIDNHECSLDEPIAPTSDEDYDSEEFLEVIPRSNCSSKGLVCHRDAKCMQKSPGLLLCKCQEGFYGDGINSCRDESLQCSAEDIEKADCGKHGRCHKEMTIGTHYQLFCVCDPQWTGKKCWEFTGRRRRLTAHPVTDHSIEFSQKLQLCFLLGFTVALITGFLFVLIFRQRYRQRAIKRQQFRHFRASNPCTHSLEPATYSTPKSSPAVIYTEVGCMSPVHELGQARQLKIKVSATGKTQLKRSKNSFTPQKPLISTQLTTSKIATKTDTHLTQLHETNSFVISTQTQIRQSSLAANKKQQLIDSLIFSTPNRLFFTNPIHAVAGTTASANNIVTSKHEKTVYADPQWNVTSLHAANERGEDYTKARMVTSALGNPSSRKTEINLMRTTLDVRFEDELIAR